MKVVVQQTLSSVGRRHCIEHLISERHSLSAVTRRISRYPAVRQVSFSRAAFEEGDKPSWSVEEAGSRKEWQREDLRVVLVNPQIPQNAGSIARTCAATSVALHLVRPLGFEIDSNKLKRAGLDYWPFVVVKVHDSWEAFVSYFEEEKAPKRMIAFSKFGKQHYAASGLYKPGDWLLFGAETTGLPPEAHEYVADSGGAVVKIPMVERHVRSLNLAVSVGVGLYEALRQMDTDGVPEP